MRWLFCAALLILPVSSVKAEEHPVSELIGGIACGAEPRAGFADIDAAGHISGVAVDLCRAVTIALFGEKGRVEFHLYDSDDAIDKARLRHDSIFFLTRDAIREQNLGKYLQAGPVVFVDPVALMVEQVSPMQQPADLEGRTVCLMIASSGQRALETFAADHALHFARLAFQEDVEMLDAYNAQRCQAAVGETTYLATMRASPGAKHLLSRLLPTALSLNPIVAATENSDKQWSQLVFRLISDLISGAADPTLGVRPNWRDAVAAATGDYNAMIQRHVVDGLGLAPGLNQAWPKGALLAP